MDLNILRIDVDRAHRVFNTNNLSLNQCSNNNRITVYYTQDVEYTHIQMSFRKPDGWVSDKVSLIFDVDEEGYKYAYYDVDEEFTSFIMGGRNAILQANLYFNKQISYAETQTATIGNIRINVNYVDDVLVNTNYSQAYINNVNATVGALQNDFNKFKTGDIEVGSALMDSHDNVIHTTYETKSDARQKYDDLDTKKLDKTEIQDQTNRIVAVETNITTTNDKLTNLETNFNSTSSTVNENKADIEVLKSTSVTETEFNTALEERRQAEIKLQSQIDGLNQSSVFKDMVDTTNKLSSYDKSKLVEGDRILVLADSIIWKWTGTEFEKVGKYGSATYTKSEIDSLHNSITNTIPNKATLANGELKLSKGNIPIATEAVKVKTVNGESIWGEGNIVIPVDSEFSQTSKNAVENRLITNALINKADASSLEELRTSVRNKADVSALESKQNKLTPGSNITISEDGVISVNGVVTLKLIPEGQTLPAIGYNNIIYIYKPDNETGYSEYLWVEETQTYEPFGEAGIHLENYYTIKQVEELLALKADQSIVNSIDSRVTTNTADIQTKASIQSVTDLNNTINTVAASLLNLQTTVANKAEKTEVVSRDEFSDLINTVDTKQEKLVSGQNIKTVNGISILGSGDLGVVNTLTDLSIYYTKEEANPIFETKADKTQLFDKDYNKLINTPDLSVYELASDAEREHQELVEEITKKQDILESGVDIKTINGNSILGEGNLDVITDLSNYYTKEEVDKAIEDVDVSEQLANYPTKTEVASTYLTQINASSMYASKGEIEQIDSKIPTKTSALINDSGFITVNDVPKDLGAFTNNPGYLTAESNAFKNKQDKLVSGTNVKTINGNSILGNGDLKLVTDISHLETKSDANSKLTEAKTYSDTNRRELQTSISSNTSLISSLRTDLSNEISSRTKGDADTLASAKAYTDNTIRDLTEDTEGALEAIKEIKDQIGGEGVNILSSINQNKTDISTVRSDLTTEISNRNTAETNLQTQITENTEDIESLQTQLNTEITNRTNGDTTLDGKITTLETKVDDNIERIDDDLISLNNKITAVEEDRKDEDGKIYAVIDEFTSNTDTKIESINGTVSSLDARVKTAQKDINDHKAQADQRFSELETKVGTKILFKNWVS